MRITLKRKLLTFLCFSFIIPMGINAQTVVKKVSADKLDYKLLKYATDAYEAGNYGEAISFAEEAKSSRKQECNWKIYVLENLQKLSYVRKAGDKLTDLLPLLDEHSQHDAYKILTDEIQKYGIERFNDSLAQTIVFLNEKKNYPEANYLEGKVYRLEGESDFARKFFLDAYAYKDFLDVPDVQYDILYDLAELCRFEREMDEYEKYLLLIAKDNRFYTNTSFMNAIVSLINRDEEENVEKFFLLYRCDDYYSIKALNLLTQYYLDTNDNEKALACSALGAITAISRIDSVLKNRLTNYVYSDFGTLLSRASKYSDITDWGNENGVWENFHGFALASNRCGKLLFSRKLLTILSVYIPEEYWRLRASQLLIP